MYYRKKLIHLEFPIYPALKNPDYTINHTKFVQDFKRKVDEHSLLSLYREPNNWADIKYNAYDIIDCDYGLQSLTDSDNLVRVREYNEYPNLQPECKLLADGQHGQVIGHLIADARVDWGKIESLKKMGKLYKRIQDITSPDSGVNNYQQFFQDIGVPEPLSTGTYMVYADISMAHLETKASTMLKRMGYEVSPDQVVFNAPSIRDPAKIHFIELDKLPNRVTRYGYYLIVEKLTDSNGYEQFYVNRDCRANHCVVRQICIDDLAVNVT